MLRYIIYFWNLYQLQEGSIGVVQDAPKVLMPFTRRSNKFNLKVSTTNTIHRHDHQKKQQKPNN